MNNEKSGSAFPSHGSVGEVIAGMTLRQYAVIKFMQASIAYQGFDINPKTVARLADLYFDDMMERLGALEAAHPAPQVPMTDEEATAIGIDAGLGTIVKDAGYANDALWFDASPLPLIRATEAHYKIGVKP